MSELQRIVIAGGGTGGHIFPATALADALKARYPQASVHFIGAAGGMEMTLVPRAGYAISGVWISGFYRQKTLRNLLRNLLLPLKFVVAHLQTWLLLRKHKPQVVVGVGGYASFTTLGVAKRMRMRCLRVVHEQNAFPGLTNRVHGKHAHLILLGDKAAAKHFPKETTVHTGNIIRNQILLGQAQAVQSQYGFATPAPTLLVTGGSLGARTLNRAMHAALPALQQAGVQVLWQCGKHYAAEYTPLAAQYPHVRIVPFIQNMGDAYAWADLVVCRAGALTIAELAALRQPAILIPSPNVADDHQTHNARSLADSGAAALLKDADAEAQLGAAVLRLLNDPQPLQQMKAALHQLPANGAARQMVDALAAGWAQLQGTPAPARTREIADLPAGSRVFLSGIGGIGMSALARYLHKQGYQVYGYDRTPTALTHHMVTEGIKITYDDSDLTGLSDSKLLIYTPAVNQDNPAVKQAQALGIPLVKRAAFLGRISREYQTLAVAGTHGKTTTSSLLAWLLHHAGADPTAFVGGEMTNFDQNLLLGKSNLLVAEADEFDRSFLHLHPRHLILTAVDADHLDIYGSAQALHDTYNALVQQVEPGGTLVLHESCREFIHSKPEVQTLVYGLYAGDIHASGVRMEGVHTYFAYHSPTHHIPNLCLPRPGSYNLLNALAAITVALQAGVSADNIASALAGYQGVRRRFQVHLNTPKVAYIDDYAHHPVEISACLQAVRQAFPGRRLIAIFQPHLFSRTRDFYNEFAQSLDAADAVLLMHIYPARELSIPQVSSDLIYQQMRISHKRIINLQEALDALPSLLSDPCVVVTMGAGDIDTQVPAIHQLLNDYV